MEMIADSNKDINSKTACGKTSIIIFSLRREVSAKAPFSVTPSAKPFENIFNIAGILKRKNDKILFKTTIRLFESNSWNV